MRILFIGSTRRGYLALESLISSNENIVGVISLRQFPDECENYESRFRELATKYAINLFETSDLNALDWERIISQEIDPDIAFVVGCRVLIPSRVYGIPKFGMLGVHDSLLPDYRGFAPLNWAIINGERSTGVTLFHLGEAVDDGDIVSQRSIDISPADHASCVYEKICKETCDLILDAIPLLKLDSALRTRQDLSAGSFSCSRSPNDGMIDWAAPTDVIFNMIRALSYPFPGAFTYYRGKKLTIQEAAPQPEAPRYVGRIPGRVVKVDKMAGFVDVLTGDGILRIQTVESDGVLCSAANRITSVRQTLGIDYVEMCDRLARLERQVELLAQRLTDDSR